MKLYLGSGPLPIHPQHQRVMGNVEEWTLVDLYVDDKKIQKWDASRLDEVSDNSVDEIYSSHLLEHFPHVEVPRILLVWKRKLKDGGKLILNVPDLAWAAEQILKLDKGETLKGYYNSWTGEHGLLSILYGSQSHKGEYHKAGFIQNYFQQLLESLEFKQVSVVREEDAHDMGVLLAEAYK